MDQVKIGLFIAKMRKKKTMTQQELANKMGVTDKAISNWENGRRMPDLSLYKDLCKELDISMNELINGEEDTKETEKDNVANAIIKTLNYNEQNKKKLGKRINILIIIIIILSIFGGISYRNYRQKFPKFDIDKIMVIESTNENDLSYNKAVNQLIATNDKLWYYSLIQNGVGLCDSKDKCYDLLIALTYNQTSMKKVRKFLNKQVSDNYLNKYDNDVATIYKSYNNKNQYEVIFCKNTEEIYFGSHQIETGLQGKYCGIVNDNKKEFTRTYKIINVTPDNSEEYINVAISQFQSNPLVSVKIPSSIKIEKDKNYEFTFTTYETFDDTIENIFNYATIKEVKVTDKLGMDQVQEPIEKQK